MIAIDTNIKVASRFGRRLHPPLGRIAGKGGGEMLVQAIGYSVAAVVAVHLAWAVANATRATF